MDKFLSQIRYSMQNITALNKEKDTLLVALSGGADSVCLLLSLRQLGYRCAAAHCNFHLRGEESERDEAFVRILCKRHEVELHTADFDTMGFAGENHQSLELAARNLRYRWFGQLMQTYAYTAVCVGHHRDDNVETLLLNLVRGTGVQGLCGMEPDTISQEFGIRILRPLLVVSREDIQAWLIGVGQTWVTDSTNLQDCAARNVIRNRVLPLLNDINPAAAKNIQRTIVNMREVRTIYNDSVSKDVEKCVCWLDIDVCTLHLIIDRTKLQQTTSPVTVLHEVLAPLGFNSTQINNLLTAKGYRNNREKGVNPVRIPHTEKLMNVIVEWDRIEIKRVQ